MSEIKYENNHPRMGHEYSNRATLYPFIRENSWTGSALALRETICSPRVGKVDGVVMSTASG